MRRTITVLTLPALLAACAANVIPYTVAPNASFATLRNNIGSVTDRKESIDISVSERQGNGERRLLYAMTRANASNQVPPVKIAANTALDFFYSESVSGGRSCTITVQARLQEGKTYSLVGGSAYG